MLRAKLSTVALAVSVWSAAAHVVMVKPDPFNLNSEPYLQSSPLSSDLPFPCQGRTQHAEHITTFTAGATQLVKFWGSAVHGGGSCQFSVAYGNPIPTDPSQWKTIYTIIGGCPADAVGNLPTIAKDAQQREQGPECGNDTGKECVRQFNVPIPKDMMNGNATFAWSWLNKIGNREFYMDCAPVTITGGLDGNSSVVDSLPPMFLANFPGQCTTGPSGGVVSIPNPGRYGTKYQDPIDGANGGCPAAPPPHFDGPAPVPDHLPVGFSASSPAGPTPSGFATVTKSAVGTGSSFVSVSVSVSPSTSYTTPEPRPGYSSVTSAALNATASSAPAAGTRPSWSTGMSPCGAADGAVFCFSPSSFGVCTQGWAVPQNLAAGQTCADGKIALSSA